MEKRVSMHPHKPHATSQPSRFSHTHRLSTDWLFELDDRDPCEVPPYTDEPFKEHVKAIATYDTHVRAVPPDPTRHTVGKRGVKFQWQTGEHSTISERHNQPGTALHTVEHPREL